MRASRFLAAVTAATALLITPSRAGEPDSALEGVSLEELAELQKRILSRDWNRAGGMKSDLAVVEIVAVPEGRYTNDRPPTVEVRVLQLLSGDKSQDRTRIRWTPTWPFPIGICGNDSRLPAWREAEFKEMPKVGDRFVVALHPAEPGSPLPSTTGRCRQPFTEEVLKEIRGWYDEGRAAHEAWEIEQAETARKRLETARAFWASRAAGVDLEGLLARAELVAIAESPGTPVSNQVPFRLREILRAPGVGAGGPLPLFISTPAPAGSAEAFPEGIAFLIVVPMKGVSTPWSGTAAAGLFEGEQGIFELTGANLEIAKRFVKDHPVTPDAERETVARCRAWTAARHAESAFLHPDSGLKYGGDTEFPLHQQDPVLAERIDRMERFLKQWPEADATRARTDEGLRAALARWLIRHARVVALRSTGLDARGGTPEELDPKIVSAFRAKAIRLLRSAAATDTVTRAELEADPELAALHGSEEWKEILESLSK